MASRVRSSSVGPSPPVVITRSERSHARPSVSMTRPMLSPTTLVWFRSMPRAGSCCAIQALFVSTISPSRISVPIATISAFTRGSLANRPKRGPYRPAVQSVSLVRRGS